MLSSSIKSQVIGDNINVRRSDATALSVALRASQQLYSASRQQTKYKSALTSIAKKLNAAIEQAIVAELGGGQITAGRGGFYPDFYITLEDGTTELREQKLVGTEEKDGGIYRKYPVKIAGGSGVTVTRGANNLLTGFDLSGKTPVAVKENINATRFVDSMLAVSGNQAALFNILSGKGAAAKAIRNTLITKASAIDIPVEFNGVLQNRTIRFSWNDMRKAALSRKGSLIVTPIDKGMKLNFSFSSGTINKALNAIERITIVELNGRLGRVILEALSEQIQFANANTAQEIRKFLESMGFSHGLEYIVGSAIISRGTVVFNKQSSKVTIGSQKFISGEVLSLMVQSRLKQTMKRSGAPTPPDLTYRTGAFVRSVNVYPNYRNNLMSFEYAPVYKNNERYGYDPTNQISSSIRQVLAKLYTKKFTIVSET